MSVVAFVRLFVMCALGMISVESIAQSYPLRPIRLITAEAGGGADLVSRLIAQGISTSIGQQVVVDNRGGSVAIPAQIVAKAPADGYTFLLYGSTIWLLPLMQDGLSYDMARDFSPVSLVATAPSCMVVHPSVSANSVKELIALAKAKPGTLNYGAGIAGSNPHLAVELFKSMANVDLVKVSYKGAGPALNAVISGEVQLVITVAGSVAPHIKSGKLRGLAVTSLKPSAILPDLPTVSATIPGYEAATMHVMFAPAGTPASVISSIRGEVAKAVSDSVIRQRLLAAGVEGIGAPAEQLAATMKADIAKMGKVIKEKGIRAE